MLWILYNTGYQMIHLTAKHPVDSFSHNFLFFWELREAAAYLTKLSYKLDTVQ